MKQFIQQKKKIGLLPLYLKLYDEVLPDLRIKLENFYKDIVRSLEDEGINVFSSPICRIEKEFKNAVRSFEENNVDAIVTLHLAYSPSMESIGTLSGTKIPLIVLDTTVRFDFSSEVSPEDIMENHGIHGVQDMCNLLKRKGKYFSLEAGHWERSDVIKRVIKNINAAVIAKNFKSSRVGTIGGFFKGMGDFCVEKDILSDVLGIKCIETGPGAILNLMPGADDQAVKDEMGSDYQCFQIEGLDKEAHIDSTRIGIAVRRWIKEQKLSSFTMNFSAISSDSGFPTLPFLEASKAMARGIGYAGEGDVITSALVGALLKVYPRTSFAEMFCPDWKDGRVFLSHMAEINISLLNKKPGLVQKNMAFIDVGDPVAVSGQFKPGKITYINLAPLRDSFNLITSIAEMEEVKSEKLKDSISGWMRPEKKLEVFLHEFSKAGGTHHSAVVYGDIVDEIVEFGNIMGWNTVKI